MSSEKFALFIDGENLHHTAKALGFNIDFKRLLTEFSTRGSLLVLAPFRGCSGEAQPPPTEAASFIARSPGRNIVTAVHSFKAGLTRKRHHVVL
jgi:uncharacterized LabA/DUF88 family protein